MPDSTIEVTKDGETKTTYATFSVLTRINQLQAAGFESDPDYEPIQIKYVTPQPMGSEVVTNPETALRWLEGRRLGDDMDP